MKNTVRYLLAASLIRFPGCHKHRCLVPHFEKMVAVHEEALTRPCFVELVPLVDCNTFQN